MFLQKYEICFNGGKARKKVSNTSIPGSAYSQSLPNKPKTPAKAITSAGVFSFSVTDRYSGIFPCFLGGFILDLFLVMSRACISLARV